MINCQAGYTLRIYLEGELQNCEPNIIEKIIKDNLKHLKYERVHVECIDCDINETEDLFTLDCCTNTDNLFENHTVDEINGIQFGLTCKICGNFIPNIKE